MVPQNFVVDILEWTRNYIARLILVLQLEIDLEIKWILNRKWIMRKSSHQISTSSSDRNPVTKKNNKRFRYQSR